VSVVASGIVIFPPLSTLSVQFEGIVVFPESVRDDVTSTVPRLLPRLAHREDIESTELARIG
jgi:hypothetical protein